MWTPYYSVHFNDPQVGLRAYHLLREFSTQRQLDPPRDMITITEDFLNLKRPRDPKEAEEFEKKYADKVGWLMEKKDRARAVMNQKATSVADISAVLAIQEQELREGFGEKNKRGYLVPSARRRRREARKSEASTAIKRAERVAGIETALSTDQVTYKVEEPEAVNVPESSEGTSPRSPEDPVKILWTDLHNARFAETWPARVRHGELDLSRDHVMPGQKPVGVEVLADKQFKEKKPAAA